MSSSTYGAPAKSPRAKVAEPEAPPQAEALEATLEAIGSGSDTRLLGLLAVIGATTVGATLIAARKRRL